LLLLLELGLEILVFVEELGVLTFNGKESFEDLLFVVEQFSLLVLPEREFIFLFGELAFTHNLLGVQVRLSDLVQWVHLSGRIVRDSAEHLARLLPGLQTLHWLTPTLAGHAFALHLPLGSQVVFCF